MINFYGSQRFGHRGQTAKIGFAFLNGLTKEIPRSYRSGSKKRLTLSAAQSCLFNRYTFLRFQRHGFSLLKGDVFQTKASGLFTNSDEEVLQARFAAREIVPTGPMFGQRCFLPQTEALELENEVLGEFGINRELFSPFVKLMPGSRRALFVYPENLTYERLDQTLALSFILPSGSYASVLCAEFTSI
jgi:tRNA pseudouridine13 synthase